MVFADKIVTLFDGDDDNKENRSFAVGDFKQSIYSFQEQNQNRYVTADI